MDGYVISIEDQKKIADEILDKLYVLDPYAIVAGGAPRDWYFNKEANDIDVFFYLSKNYTCEVIDKLLSRLGLDMERLGPEEFPKGYQLNPNIYQVFNVKGYSTPVQLILLNSPTWEAAVPQFPLSICKAWYKNGKSGYDRDFLISVSHGVIYTTNELYANGNAYLEKIYKRFPNFERFNNKMSALEYIAMEGEY